MAGVAVGLTLLMVPAVTAAPAPDEARFTASALPASGATAWFFSEGTTLRGFYEYLTIVNPDGSAALDVTIDYALEVVPGVAGTPKTTTVSVPAGQRRTVEVFNEASGGVGRNAPAPQAPGAGYTGVAAKLTAAKPFIAERPMYFVNPFDIGVVNGAHNALGVSKESTTWYFAEGSTLPGFQPFFTLQNARTAPADVQITYATEDPDGSQTRTLTLPPTSRTTVDIRSATSPGGLGSEVTGFGTTIQSTSPIVAERPFYVNRDIGGAGAINGAHDERGATELSPIWTFAEGTALSNFFEFLTLYNPSPLAANVEVTYQLDGGSPQVRTVSVPAGRRQTVQVFNELSTGGLGRSIPLAANPTSGGISAKLRATNGIPFLAERPMYVAGQDFGGGPVNGAHDVAGFPGLGAPQWTFAEGTVRPGFFEFLTLQNPGAAPVATRIDYLVNGGPVVTRNVTLPAASRTTVVVFGDISQGGYGPQAEATSSDIGARITAVDEASLIVAERPMYMRRDFEGSLIDDAHNTLGFPNGAPQGQPDEPVVTVTQTSTESLTLHVEFPDPHFFPVSGAGQSFTGMTMDGTGTFPGSDSPDAGKPGVPTLGVFFAIPDGTASISMQVLASESDTLTGINLAPGQPDPSDSHFQRPDGTGGVDENFFTPPFEYDAAFYAMSAIFPSSPASAMMAGDLRDIGVGELMLFGGQYNPATDALQVLQSADVKVNFGPNSGTFASGDVASVWNLSFQDVYASHLVNWSTVLANLGPILRQVRCGDEFLIITTSALYPAAAKLQDFRDITSGIPTGLAEIGKTVVNTPAGIQSYIRSLLNDPDCETRPSYVLLMGDAPEITASINNFAWANNVATDLFYALKDNADFLPDLAIGRIPARTLTDAMTAVDKVIAYETNPPADGDFYTHTFNASFFEGTGKTDSRPYVQVSEQVRDELRGLGYSVDRIYTGSPPTGPINYKNGTPMPFELQKPGFPWNGGTNDIINQWNQGRFLVFQRDHGYSDGWSAPSLGVGDIPSLTESAELPVSFSINCTSGYYDDPSLTQHHAERLLARQGGGAVGVIAASRVSPTYQNNNFVLGLYDALFPSMLPAYGGPVAIRRMGDVLVRGKFYVTTTDGAQAINLALYQYFGDPTMQLHVGDPFRFDFSKFIIESLPDRIRVRWPQPDPPPDGTIFTLQESLRGTTLGRAVMMNGMAEVMHSGQFSGQMGFLSFDKKDFLPAVQMLQI